MTMNRLITTIVQIVFGVPVFTMFFLIVKDGIKNGFFPDE